jgi:hypothetical protein
LHALYITLVNLSGVYIHGAPNRSVIVEILVEFVVSDSYKLFGLLLFEALEFSVEVLSLSFFVFSLSVAAFYGT